MRKFEAIIAVTVVILLGGWAWAAGTGEKQPLKLIKSVPLPELHDGDFDHFTVDLQGKRLFAAAEENGKVLVFDLDSGKLLQTMSDLKAPHSLVYRDDLKKLFVVDGDLGKIRMYDGVTYKNAGDIDVREGADSMAYDPATKYMYVITGGSDAKMPNAYLTTVDSTTGKKMGDIKLDSDDVEAVVLEKSGPRAFVVIRGKNTVEVFDRQKQTLLATWPLLKDATKPTAMAFDEATHRLFIGTRSPGKLVVIDSNSGQVVANQPGAAMIDDMGFDSAHKLVFFAATEFLDVYQERDPDHVEQIAHVPTAFRAKTGIFVPELNRYYLGVPHHETKSAELRIYEVTP
jgi:DNA-binding beta-propeller fold protein YncE